MADDVPHDIFYQVDRNVLIMYWHEMYWHGFYLLSRTPATTWNDASSNWVSPPSLTRSSSTTKWVLPPNISKIWFLYKKCVGNPYNWLFCYTKSNIMIACLSDTLGSNFQRVSSVLRLFNIQCWSEPFLSKVVVGPRPPQYPTWPPHSSSFFRFGPPSKMPSFLLCPSSHSWCTVLYTHFFLFFIHSALLAVTPFSK